MTLNLSVLVVVAIAANLLVALYFFGMLKAEIEDELDAETTSSKIEHFKYAVKNWSGSCLTYVCGISLSALAYTKDWFTFNSLACILLIVATYLLAKGLFQYINILQNQKRFNKLYTFTLCAICIVLIVHVTGLHANAFASFAMAVQFAFCANMLTQSRRKPTLLKMTISAVLKTHVLVMVMQSLLLVLDLNEVFSVPALLLQQIVLVSHLLLTIATALILPGLFLLKRQQYWQILANYDGLTRLLNRRAFIDIVTPIIKKKQRHSHALLIIDIDHFKRVNDKFGHQGGDEILRKVAETLKDEIRSSDKIGRLGGEEFGIFMPKVKSSVAFDIAARLRKKIEETTVKYMDKEVNVTISIGIHVISQSGEWDRLFQQADEALYTAKELGRNQVYPKTHASVGI